MHKWRGGECCVGDKVKESARYKKKEAVIAANTRTHSDGLQNKEVAVDCTPTHAHTPRERHVRSRNTKSGPMARRHAPANTIARCDSVALDTH